MIFPAYFSPRFRTGEKVKMTLDRDYWTKLLS